MMTKNTPLRDCAPRTPETQGCCASRSLVVHTGGLGDFLLACPAIQALAREGRVELLGRPERLELAVAGGIAVAAHGIEGVGFDSLFGTPTAMITDFLGRFDRCIVWMRDDGTLARAIRSCGVRDVRTFPGLPPEDWRGHASTYYARALGFDELPPFHLSVAPAQSYDVVIHPGSGGRRKNWPWERFVALAEALAREGRLVAWCLGPAEEEGPWNAVHPLIRPAHPLDLARHLAGAALYIGNDSGATHLAATVGCPTVAIFGPTDASTWAPCGPNVRVVTGHPWPEVRDVLAGLKPEA
jgi:heptosyltransferase III